MGDAIYHDLQSFVILVSANFTLHKTRFIWSCAGIGDYGGAVGGTPRFGETCAGGAFRAGEGVVLGLRVML